MIRLALACLLTGCSAETLSLHPPVEQTPARKTAIDFARRNPHMAIGRIHPDGRMFEARDRDNGTLLLLPEAEVRTGVLKVIPCPAKPLLPGGVCLSLEGRDAAYWETPGSVAQIARRLGGEPDSPHTAQFLHGGVRYYIGKHRGKPAGIFAIRQLLIP